MIKKEDIVEIGSFRKTHALQGELNAILDMDGDYAEDGNPLILDIDGIYVPFYAESVRPKGAESFLVKLKDVDTQEAAQPLVNKTIYGLRTDLVDYFDDPDAELISDFIGFKLVDSNLGEIGIIEDLDDSTANVLFIVKTPQGDIVYVPAAEEFINAIDDDKEVIETTLPEGLVDLNKKEE